MEAARDEWIAYIQQNGSFEAYGDDPERLLRMAFAAGWYKGETQKAVDFVERKILRLRAMP